MSGLLINERFVAVFPSLVRLLGSIESAVILQHLHFSVDETGWSRISQQQISDETGIALRTVERRLKWLRDGGWVEAERSAPYDATLKYRLVLDRVAESAKVADSRPQPLDHPAKVADSDPAKVADSSLQKGRTPTQVGEETSPWIAAPLRHPSRQITQTWLPRPEFWDYLTEKYPLIYDLGASTTRFRNYHLSKQTTSKSWEALLENWVSNDNERAEKDMREGTDDLGVPRTQKRKSVVPDAPRPGDPDYFDPDEYLQQAQEAGK